MKAFSISTWQSRVSVIVTRMLYLAFSFSQLLLFIYLFTYLFIYLFIYLFLFLLLFIYYLFIYF